MSDPLLSKPTLYVLISEKDNRTYVGSTNNFEERLKLRNSGRVKSTKHRIPLKVLFTEGFKTIQEAKKCELYYKSGAERRKLKKFFSKTLGLSYFDFFITYLVHKISDFDLSYQMR